MIWRWIKRGLISIALLFLLLLIVGMLIPPDNKEVSAPIKEVADESPEPAPPPSPPPPQSPSTSPSIESRVRAVAKSAIEGADFGGLNYEGVQVSADEDDNGRVIGTVSVLVSYHLPELPDVDDDAAKFSASLYQNLFALGPAISLVAIAFNGPIVDRYGHTSERTYIEYSLARNTYDKIEWRDFDALGLCSFLRAENPEENMCELWPDILSEGVEQSHP